MSEAADRLAEQLIDLAGKERSEDLGEKVEPLIAFESAIFEVIRAAGRQGMNHQDLFNQIIELMVANDDGSAMRAMAPYQK